MDCLSGPSLAHETITLPKTLLAKFQRNTIMIAPEMTSIAITKWRNDGSTRTTHHYYEGLRIESVRR